MGINGDAHGARGYVSGARGTKGNVSGICCVTHTCIDFYFLLSTFSSNLAMVDVRLLRVCKIGTVSSLLIFHAKILLRRECCGSAMETNMDR